MLTAIDYLTQKGWKKLVLMRRYDNYPNDDYGFRNYVGY